MKNVFQRAIDPETLKDVPKSDYEPGELVSYLTTAFPGDPKGALRIMKDNYEIGLILFERTRILLEGLRYAKRD